MPKATHYPMPVDTARVWTGRYHEWVSHARCVCGWSVVAENERLAELAAAEHAAVCNSAAEPARR